VKKAIQKPEKRPLSTEPMKALSIVLKAAAEGESSHDMLIDGDFIDHRMRDLLAIIKKIFVRCARHCLWNANPNGTFFKREHDGL
jgi:hypothetical protein